MTATATATMKRKSNTQEYRTGGPVQSHSLQHVQRADARQRRSTSEKSTGAYGYRLRLGTASPLPSFWRDKISLNPCNHSFDEIDENHTRPASAHVHGGNSRGLYLSVMPCLAKAE
jgi:hypothetical protein